MYIYSTSLVESQVIKCQWTYFSEKRRSYSVSEHKSMHSHGMQSVVLYLNGFLCLISDRNDYKIHN